MPILDDATYVEYGGWTGTSTVNQRLIAYQIADEQVAFHLGTYLEPTEITGSFIWPYPDTRLRLPESDLISVKQVLGLYDNYKGETQYATGSAYVLNQANSVIQLIPPAYPPTFLNFRRGIPDRLQLVYEVGLPSGEATSNFSFLKALTDIASMHLKQIVDPSEAQGGEGDPGLKSWSDSGYSETRVEPKKSSLGNNAKAEYAARLLRPKRKMRAVKL